MLHFSANLQMNKLKLSKFKAFEGEITIPLDNKKNLLLYGENGAGKSSIYESIKVIFFKDKIESQITAQTPEDLQEYKNELWSSYNNKINNQDFEIEINNTDYKTFSTSDYQVFMISIEELTVENKINLKSLLNRFFFSVDDIDILCQNNHENIEEEVNQALLNFKENVTIEIDEEDDYAIKIIDSKKNIERKSDIKKYFNEAKLNLIILLILLNTVIKSKDGQKSKILVLDDFITSLDSANRTFIIKYIFDKFQDTQIIILTHNIGFYNLILFVIEIDNTKDKWEFSNLFEINNNHKLYVKSEIEEVKSIKNNFYALANPDSNEIENIGNRIRKKFEILLYEFSKLLMIGTVEDSKKILDRITQGKAVYFKDKNTASDLIDSIETILLEQNPNNLTARLQNKIGSYKNSEFGNFQKILKELKLYQKITMHPMSHGTNGMPIFTIKEIEKSIALLEKMEAYLKDMVNKNAATV